MKSKKIYIYGVYSVIFVLLSLIVFYPFYSTGKTFIWMVDGWQQHYKALIYYKHWLETILNNIFVKHIFEIPMYSINIGYGSDILTTFNYYVIGDPLTVFVILFEDSKIYLFYDLLIYVRIFLSGLTFIMYLEKRNIEDMFSMLAGGISYAFCGFVLYAAIKNPFFINAMIYLPIMLIGVENIILKKKWLVLTVITAVSAISNFYFFYMLVIFTVIYGIARVISEKYEWKEVINSLVRCLMAGIIGVMLSATVLLPIIMFFKTDNRVLVENACDYFFGINYYKSLLQNMVSYKSQDDYCVIGFSMILFMIVTNFIARRSKERSKVVLKIVLLIATIGLIFPVFGKIMNGMSYVSVRWIFGYNFILSYIVAVDFRNFLKIEKKDLLKVFAALVAYYVAIIKLNIIINYAMGYNTLIGIGLIIAIFAVNYKNIKIKKYLQYAVLLAIIVSITINSKYAYSIKGDNEAIRYVTKEMLLDGYGTNETEVLLESANEEFYRYSAEDVTFNTTINNGLYSTQYFWSLSNNYITSYLMDMSVLENTGISRYGSLDARTALETLAGVKYYTKKADSLEVIPYGFEKTEVTKNGYELYENKFALPMGYTYDEYLVASDEDAMDSIEYQQNILDTVILDKNIQNDTLVRKTNIDRDVAYRHIYQEYGNNFEVKDTKEKISLSTEYIKDYTENNVSEKYLYIKGLNYNSSNKKIQPENLWLYIKWQSDGEEYNKTISLTTNRYKYYAGRHDFVVNLGYNDIEKLELSFSTEGSYNYEELSLVAIPMEKYEQSINKLSQNVMYDINLNNDNKAYATREVTGKINLSKDKILLLNIPYSKGFRAYVDGSETEIYRANGMFMAIEVKAGEHEIHLIYKTHWLNIGYMLTVLGMVMAVIYYIVNKHREINYEKINC